MSFDWLQTLIFLLPLAGLVWRAALQSGELKQLRRDVDEQKARMEKLTTGTLQDLRNLLQSIELRLTRIETSLEREESRPRRRRAEGGSYVK